MVSSLQRWALLIELHAENPYHSTVMEELCLFRMAEGQSYTHALRLDEIGVPFGEEPRWFLSYAEAETAQERLMPAAHRALTFWLVEHVVPRRNCSVTVTIITEDAVKAKQSTRERRSE